jgi:23S rRNA pseudouridine955/2504/2580 synthase
VSAVELRPVAEDDADLRLDRWFRRHFPDLPHGRLQKLLRTGQIRVNGKRAQANARLEAGQTIRIPPMPPPEPETELGAGAGRQRRPHLAKPGDRAELEAMILHQDDALIVLNKPPGLAVQGGTKTTRHLDGMLEAFADRHGRPRLVHRLDRDTSGVLVVARTASAAAKLARAFQQHRAKKLYWALVAGLPPLAEGVIEKPLAKETQSGRELVMADAADGRPARTDYRTIARAGKVAAWLGLMPHSGRTHQLRVHCAAMGTPIIGDPKYGGAAARLAGAPRGLMLHAREIEMPHPDGGRLTVTAPMSDIMIEGFAWIGFEADPSLPGAGLADFDQL